MNKVIHSFNEITVDLGGSISNEIEFAHCLRVDIGINSRFKIDGFFALMHHSCD